jgi:hypothetical protein
LRIAISFSLENLLSAKHLHLQTQACSAPDARIAGNLRQSPEALRLRQCGR